MSGLITKLNERVEERSILNHPFYQAWEQGKLTIGDLQRYAPQYRYLETQIARTFEALRRHFPNEERFDEAYREECEHVLYWVNFCERLGLERREVRSTQALPATRALAELLSEMRWFPSSALVSAYVIESQNPKVAETKRQGLIDCFGFKTDDPALTFFSEHIEKDPHHVALLEETILKSEVEETQALAVADEILELLWGFLDGVNERRIAKEAELGA